MNPALHRTAALLERLIEVIGLCLLPFALYVGVGEFLVTALRYGIGFSQNWLNESVLAANAVIFLLGASWALQHDQHVRVDRCSRFNGLPQLWRVRLERSAFDIQLAMIGQHAQRVPGRHLLAEIKVISIIQRWKVEQRVGLPQHAEHGQGQQEGQEEDEKEGAKAGGHQETVFSDQ